MSISDYPYITVYVSVSGWKAVMIHLAKDPVLGSFEEPLQTGIGAYETREEAESEARIWAESEGCEVKL
jgi:hypothetical protein